MIDYKSSGVDIEAGDNLVEWLKENPQNSGPFSKNVISGIGGFAALFRFPSESYRKPILVSSTDGVGTKVRLAADFDRVEGIGQDLVGMCANDLVTVGARPLFFLDYFATAKLDLKQAQAFLKGLRDSCASIGCELIGGETAEMPGIYQNKDFDCAGFIVGVAEEDKLLGPHRVKSNQVLIGVESSGFHSNGYSLLRKVFEKDLSEHLDMLMKPTTLYVNAVLELVKEDLISAVAHITGGGLQNLPRVLPNSVSVNIKKWELPKAFQLVQNRTQMSFKKLSDVLNCGLGLVIITDKKNVERVQSILNTHSHPNWILGETVNDNEKSPRVFLE